MLPTEDLETLIQMKRLEIEKEKTSLGLTRPQSRSISVQNKENAVSTNSSKQVKIAENCQLRESYDVANNEEESDRALYDLEENIPADLERYIRRYTGLPIMLKAGEYSPNNPLIRGERSSGDALLGLGEYERRRNTLRKIRQQQYREYLDQQAKKKQEAKEQAERKRREKEDREEARERERRLLELERHSPERRPSLNYAQSYDTKNCYTNKVDTGVQVGSTRPHSVAVQTDETDFYSVSPTSSPTKCKVTQAERELSPRTVLDHDERSVRNSWTLGTFEERPCKRSSREQLETELKKKYLPSIFDADAIQLRNAQAEKEAAARKQFYQQELKNQIQEQQRIREERKSREKMLEQAEMRRLEEQLRMLKMAQEREIGKQLHIDQAMTKNSTDFQKKRASLQKEIDLEHQALLRTTSNTFARNTHTSKSDTAPSKLPFYYPKIIDRTNNNNTKPYSVNIPDNSIFSSNYDVDSYLRRNLNPSKNSVYRLEKSKDDCKIYNDILNPYKCKMTSSLDDLDRYEYSNKKVEKAIVHEIPKDRKDEICMRDLDTLPIPVLRHDKDNNRCTLDHKVGSVDNKVARVDYKVDKLDNKVGKVDNKVDKVDNKVGKVDNKVGEPDNKVGKLDNRIENLSDAMKLVDDKWKVPVVQKNILKSIPNEEGKNVSILTQLGSIRRQLQLEQLKLDNMMNNE